MPPPLILVSLMAESLDPLYRELPRYLEQRGLPGVRVLDDVPWEARREALRDGRAQVGHVCSSHYLDAAGALVPLVGLTRASARYRGEAIYFSDVVVRADSPIRRWEDLAGARWAYNEPTSHSGVHVVSAELAAGGRSYRWFGEVVRSGGHLRSLQWVLEGRVDAAALDSTVLGLERVARPELAEQVRVVASLGPSPSPPLVARRDLDPKRVTALREVLLGMGTCAEGRALLAPYQGTGFATRVDEDFDVVRRMRRRGRGLAGSPAVFGDDPA